MASLGFPNSWPVVTAVGHRTAGAVQKGSTTALGFPKPWPVVTAVGYRNAGAVQRPPDISGSLTATLGACTLVGTGTFVAPVAPGGGGSHGGGLLEDVARPRYIQRNISAIASSVGRTTAMATGSLDVQPFALARGIATTTASGSLHASITSASRGHSATIGAGGMRMSARTLPYTRRISAPFAIG